VSSLLDDGYQVRILDRDGDKVGRRDAILRGAQVVTGDMANREDVRRALEGAQFVFHCAYATVPRTAAADPILDVSANIIPLLGLLEAVVTSGSCKRFIYFSSGGTVYGPDVVEPINEEQPTNPISAYGVSKLMSEKYVQLYARRHGFEGVILRLSNPFGPRQNLGIPQGVIGHFLSRVSENKSIEVWGDGKVVRDYFYSEDMNNLILQLAKMQTVQGTFNIGSGSGRSILDLIEVIQNITGRDIQVQHLVGQVHDAPSNVLDVSKASRVLGWRVATSFEKGVAATWKQISNSPRGAK
jgi:UDP-glucose 4-epimerase